MKCLPRIVALLAALALVPGCNRQRITSGPLPHDIYVWQRVWTPEVVKGLAQSRDSMQRFVVFAGQITLTATPPKIVSPDIDYEQLKKAGRPAGLALRVDPYSGPFRADDVAIRSITQLARERLAEARRQGIDPVELHFDFDCAESKLDGYRIWLAAVREAVKPLPVYPTVLPSWLKHKSFAQLAKESGEYILQVHCVAPPRTVSDTLMLTNPEQAAVWVKQAARIGVPFRVALPTYTYLVAFDAQGKPNGVSAEGPSARWREGSRVVRWEADPAELASLVFVWTHRRPTTMKGVIWYRLPVASDSFNWRWTTLAAVMQGRAPASDLRIEVSSDQPSDVVISNHGERDEPLPGQIEATCEGAALTTADALAEYEIASQAPARVVFRLKPEAALSRLSPGTRRPIGWIRCEKPAHIRVAAIDGVSRSGPGNHSGPEDRAGDRH